MAMFMFKISISRSATTSYRTRNLSKGLSSVIGPTILHRDVFIYDHSFSIESWKQIHEKGSSTKHPSSGHVVAEYSTYVHNNSKYHFNSLGEFSLIYTSAIPLSDTDQRTTIDFDLLRTKIDVKTHSVLIHPDGLSISGLKTTEIPTIVDLILKDEPVDAIRIRKLLPSNCIVKELPTLVIVASSNKFCSMATATKVLQWFQAALDATGRLKDSKVDEIKGTDSVATPLASPLLLLASELGGHRNSSTVLLLPSEDSFEFVSSEQSAKTILSNFNVVT